MRLLPLISSVLISIAMLALAAAASPAVADGPAARPLPPDDGLHEFTITAGGTFFEQTPALGLVCSFDFGDPKGAFNRLTGYNAAHVYEKPGTYVLTVRPQGQPAGKAIKKTVHVLPDTRGVLKIQPGDNLADVLKGVRNDTLVLFPPGVTMDLTAPVEIKARNVEFRAAGPGPAPRIRRVAGKGSSTLIPQGLDIAFRGIEFDSDKPMSEIGSKKVNYRAVNADTGHLALIGCTFRNVDDAIFCTSLTRGVLVQWCKFTSEVRGCGVWCDGSNVILLGNKFATSQQEHNVRSSQTGFYNLLVVENDFTSTEGKETLTFRNGQDLYAIHNAFHKGWVRTGPGPRGDNRPMNAIELKKGHVDHVVLEANGLYDGAWFQINEGSSDVTVRYNRVDSDGKSPPVHVEGPSLKDIRVEDNYRVLNGTPTNKPFVRANQVGPEDFKERGSRTKVDEHSPITEDRNDKK
ncbi:MAG: hypothetical protein JWL69_4286 [Phycisphaerales bacterium]|nr:hypothetical protein [Phycisphaerales bacterium]